MGASEPIVTMEPIPTIEPITTTAPSVSMGPSVTISLTTLITILCVIVIVAVFIAMIIGMRRQNAASARSLRQIVLACLGIAAAVGIGITALLGGSVVSSSGSHDTGGSPIVTEDRTTAGKAQSPAVLTPPPGLSQDVFDEIIKYCNDIMYYSNQYCGTSYDAPTPNYNSDTGREKTLGLINSGNLDGSLTMLAANFNEAYISIYLYESAGSNNPSDYMKDSIQSALKAFEDYFDTKLTEKQSGSGSGNGGGNTEAGPQEDYLSGKVFVTEGYSSGGMYVEGQAFYFDNGRVYAGLPNDSAAAIKKDSRLFTPYDMSYSIDGNTITISGGGNIIECIYDPSSETIRMGNTELKKR